MTQEDLIEVVDQLNQHLQDNNEEHSYFSLLTSGYADAIYFNDGPHTEILLWDSENDDREEEEELLDYIKKVFNNNIDKLEDLRF